jgi:hypothetical protein
MDYKQLDSKYAEFGNFNYGAVGYALGFSAAVLMLMAGAAQIISDKGISQTDAFIKAYKSRNDVNHPYGDNLEDQLLIYEGISAAIANGYQENTIGYFDVLSYGIFYPRDSRVDTSYTLEQFWKIFDIYCALGDQLSTDDPLYLEGHKLFEEAGISRYGVSWTPEDFGVDKNAILAVCRSHQGYK